MSVVLEERPLAAASRRLRRVRSQVRRSNPPTVKPAYIGPVVSQTSARGGDPEPAHGTVPPRLLGVRDAARYLAVSPFTVRNMIRDGRLRPVVIPGLTRVLVDVHDLDTLIESWKASERKYP